MIIKIKTKKHHFCINNQITKDSNGKGCVFNGRQCKIFKKGNKLLIERKFDATQPIYYVVDEDCVYISSSIRKLPYKYRKRINNGRLNEFLTYGYVFPPETLWHGIYKMPVLTCAEIFEEHNKIKFKLNYDFSPTLKVSALRTNLIKPLKKSGCSLMFSGGLDSTILAKLYEKQIKNNYASGFEFDKEDLIEKEYAYSAAKSLGIDIKYVTYNVNDLLLLLPEAILNTEAPLNHIQTLLIFKIIKDIPLKDKYIYNGQGADAIFGTGVQSQYFNNRIDKLTRKKRIKNFYLGKELVDEVQEFEFNKNQEIKSDLDLDFYFGVLGDCETTIESWALLAKYCKKVMIFPFFSEVNYNLVKNEEWENKLKEPKHMLREFARNLGISETIIDRKKASFGPVSTEWGEYLIPLIPLCDCIKLGINMEIMLQSAHRYNLWNLINLAIWKMVFIDNIEVTTIQNKIKELLKHEN